MECNMIKNGLRMVRGNAFSLRIKVRAYRIDGTEIGDFVLNPLTDTLLLTSSSTVRPLAFSVEDGSTNNAVVSFGAAMQAGYYGLDFSGVWDGVAWRFSAKNVFQIVELTAQGNVPKDGVIYDDTYDTHAEVTLTSQSVQSDWAQNDPTNPSFIRNKPEIYTKAEINVLLDNIYTKSEVDGLISDEEERAKAAEKANADDIDALETRMGTAEDDIDAIESKIPAAASSSNKLVDKQQMDNATADFITKSVNDLVNYYLKSDTYTKSEVQQLIAAVKQFMYEVVQTLPTASASTMNKIYLVPSTNPKTKNVKDEYITIATETEEGGETVTTYSWEQIGSTTVDLSGYYTSAQTDTAISNALTTALADYSTTSEMNTAITNALNTALADYSTTTEMTAAIATAIANYYTKSEVDALIANFITKSVNDLVNYYLKSDTYTKSEVQQLIAAVKQFTYEVVQTLPTASASTMNKIYLVPSTNPKTKNVKDEYITIATETEEGGETVTTYSWEQIGSTTVDLSGYYTSAQTDTAISNALTTALADYSTTSEMNTAITNALNTALADYSTTTEMTAAIATAIANYYTKSEVDALIANFITKSVNDLVNYYLKSDTYTKSEVQQLIAAVKQFTYEVVQTLPTASESTMNKIYLVPSADPQTQNVKDEYITIATETEENNETVTTYSWELIGSTQIDLSNYYTKSQTDSAISNALTTALADYSTTSEMNTAISGKADKLPMTGAGAATENNFMAIDANGNIKDSGKNENSFLTQHQSIKTINSASIVGSGNVDLQVPITDNAIIGNGYAVCSTAGDTQQKEVSITNFLLIKNGVVSVKFANAITVASPTLKINDIAAKAIYLNGAAVQPGWILAGVTVNMRYNGAQFDIISMIGPEKTDDELLVDMGLPSGLLWATRNIDVKQANGFAKNIYQYECSFFSWGNTDGHNPTAINSFAPYSWGNANTSEPYASSPGAALTASFGLSFDAAFANLGNQWRIPTTEEFAELFNNIDYINPDGTVIETTQANKLVTVNGVVGILLKSKNNSRTLFFPCSGYGNGQSWNYRGSYGNYWSSSLNSATNGRNLDFYSGGVHPQGYNNRFYGFSVRPVQNLLSPAQ